MKNLNRIACIICCFTLTVSICRIQASETDVREQFEKKYHAWKVWVTDHPYSSTHTSNSEFAAIVKLGLPILPLLVEKIENSQSDFHLQAAIFRITKKRFERSQWPKGDYGGGQTAAELYVQWWNEGRKHTANEFATKYAARKEAIKQGETEKADRLLKEITWLGIDALPQIIEKIEAGDKSLIPIVSKLTDGAVEVKSSKSDCLDWLENNKDKWVMPPIEDGD